MLELGSKAPHFSLKSTDNKTVSLDDYSSDKPLLVMFICNHCPYVIHIHDALVKMANTYKEKGINFVAINSNDTEKYPDDSHNKMKELKDSLSLPFEYLLDETQEVAKAYKAACTPDFFLFDKNKTLVYRGQMDSSRPGNDVPNDGKDLYAAMDALLEGKAISDKQIPSMGCNIKWKTSNEPEYFSNP